VNTALLSEVGCSCACPLYMHNCYIHSTRCYKFQKRKHCEEDFEEENGSSVVAQQHWIQAFTGKISDGNSENTSGRRCQTKKDPIQDLWAALPMQGQFGLYLVCSNRQVQEVVWSDHERADVIIQKVRISVDSWYRKNAKTTNGAVICLSLQQNNVRFL
jgi:hypothetical protein